MMLFEDSIISRNYRYRIKDENILDLVLKQHNILIDIKIRVRDMFISLEFPKYKDQRNHIRHIAGIENGKSYSGFLTRLDGSRVEENDHIIMGEVYIIELGESVVFINTSITIGDPFTIMSYEDYLKQRKSLVPEQSTITKVDEKFESHLYLRAILGISFTDNGVGDEYKVGYEWDVTALEKLNLNQLKDLYNRLDGSIITKD